MEDLYPNEIDEDFAYILSQLEKVEVVTVMHNIQQRVGLFTLRGHRIRADTDSATSSRRTTILHAELGRRLNVFKYGNIINILFGLTLITLYFTVVNYVSEKGLNLSTPSGGLTRSQFVAHCEQRYFTKAHISKLIHLHGGGFEQSDRKDKLIEKLCLCLEGCLGGQVGFVPTVVLGSIGRGGAVVEETSNFCTGMSTRSRDTMSLIEGLRGLTLTPTSCEVSCGGGGGVSTVYPIRRSKSYDFYSDPPPPPIQRAKSVDGKEGPSQARCNVCFDALMTPTRLGCGHVFCSMCVGRVQGEDGDELCPICREPCDPRLNLPLFF